MRVRWAGKALDDLRRVHDFLAEVHPRGTVQVVRLLTHGVGVLRDNPRLGRRVEGFEPRDVRRLIVANYGVRYELIDSDAFILRVWHTREDR